METPGAKAARLQAEVDRLRAVINKAVEDLPEWSAGALKHLSPAEALADEVRMTLRAAVTR
jgi:cob(I)alamin adenosyltransferase